MTLGTVRATTHLKVSLAGINSWLVEQQGGRARTRCCPRFEGRASNRVVCEVSGTDPKPSAHPRVPVPVWLHPDQKIGSGGSAKRADLEQHARTYRQCLKDQVDLYAPHLIIGCGVERRHPHDCRTNTCSRARRKSAARRINGSLGGDTLVPGDLWRCWSSITRHFVVRAHKSIAP